ncbi:hypothetical protein ACH5AC_35180 [Streptomyces sp. NPDC018693]|uniref:hypothetical protein n=1 Tax=Streptomyces sp. NPDC018693 TaxID=3365051 RepID=UPI0037BD3B2D
MNTERPDHDDAARDTDGAAEHVEKGSPQGKGATGDRVTAAERTAPGTGPAAAGTEAAEVGSTPEGRTDQQFTEMGDTRTAAEPQPEGTHAATRANGEDARPATDTEATDTHPALDTEAKDNYPATRTEAEGDRPAPSAQDGPPAADPGSARPAPDAEKHQLGPEAEHAHPAHGPEEHVDLGVRSGRRRSRLVVAAVAAAVMVVGGGGAYLAASADGGGGVGAPSGDGTPPVLVLDGYSVASETNSGSSNGIAPGEPNPYGVVYEADGALPEGPGSAAVRWVRGEVGQDDVVRLAEALGVDAAPVLEKDVWRVGGTADGSGPVLRVDRQSPGAWTFSRYAAGSDNCPRDATVCPHKTSPSPAGDPVGEDAARKAAAPVLKAVGQDDAKVDASQVMGAERVVNADPVVGGLPTYGWSTGIIVNALGEVVGGNGRLAEPVKGETYPVLDAEETLGLLNSAQGGGHGIGIGGCATPVPHEDQADGPCEPSTVAPDKDTLTVEDAVFGLAPHTSAGRPLLVPSWLFTVRAPGASDTYTVTHPAVDPRHLAPATATATPPPGVPTEQPSPRPTGPGDEPTASDGTRDVDVEAYSAEGRELTVRFTAGVCADYTVNAVEGEDKVTVTVTEKSWPNKVCILIAKVYHRTVQLDEPLGGRTVVGSDGAEIPLEKPGARLPDKTSDQPR